MKKIIFMLTVLVLAISGCVKRGPESAAANRQEYVDSLRNILSMTVEGRISLDNNLDKFDTLDYKVFTEQQWTLLHESHAEDIVVTWPDGHKTTGLEKHIEDLKAMFVATPDLRITTHPIRFGSASGDWTCVTGVMESKNVSIPMCTVGKWKDGVMIEKYYFWDKR